MRELDCKEGRTLKTWCFWTIVLEKTLKSPWDCKETKPINPKGNQSWTFIWRTDAETNAPITRPPDVKSQLIGKNPDAGKDWRWEEKGMTEDEMVGWHHWLNGHHQFERTRGDSEGGKTGVLKSMGSQRVGHNWVIQEQQQQFSLRALHALVGMSTLNSSWANNTDKGRERGV